MERGEVAEGKRVVQLSETQHERLRALAAQSAWRVGPALVEGQRVWVKRFGAEPLPWAKRLHALLSPFLHPVHLRASPRLDSAGLVERETRKNARFSSAGFPTPDLLGREADFLVLDDMGPSVLSRLRALRRSDPAAHDRLVAGCAHALGRVHAAGLCHGRPHPRDMFLNSAGTVGFLDFEEEPEATMPLHAAQARDLWLFFLHMPLPLMRGAGSAALTAYSENAPPAVLLQLRPLLRAFHPIATLGRALPAVLIHHDYQRIITASNLLAEYL